jgi:hypothetical protein
MMKYVVDCRLDIDKVFGQGHIPSAKLAWKYVHGQPLVPHEKMPYLQTWVRQLHDWYTQEEEKERKMCMVGVITTWYWRLRNYSIYSFKTLSTKLSSVAIVYK